MTDDSREGYGVPVTVSAAPTRRITFGWPLLAVAAASVISVTSLRFWAINSQGMAVFNPAKPWLAVVQPLVAWGLCAAVARDWRRARTRLARPLVVAVLLVGFAAANALLHPYFDRPALREMGLDSDIDDEFIVAAGEALALRNPYGKTLYTGNPISEGPAWVIANAPFGSRRTFALLASFHALLFAWALWRTSGHRAGAALGLLLALGSVGLWESAFGASLSAAGFAMAAATMVCLGWCAYPAAVMAAAVATGVVATVRLPFVVFPALSALLLWRAGDARNAAVVAVVGTAVAVGSHLVFGWLQPESYPPLHLVAQSVGRLGYSGLLVIAGLVGTLAWFVRRVHLGDAADVLLWQGLGLFIPFAVLAAQSIVTNGLTGENWTRYLAPAIPSFAAAASLGACRATPLQGAPPLATEYATAPASNAQAAPPVA